MPRTKPPAPTPPREPTKCDPERQQWCWALRESFRPPYTEGLGLTRAGGWVDGDAPGAPPRFQGILNLKETVTWTQAREIIQKFST